MIKKDEEKIIEHLNLEGLSKNDSGYNFRCPVCGDSKKSESKRRGWILTGRSYLVYYCFNCGFTTSLKNFVYKYHRDLFYKFYTNLPKSKKIEEKKAIIIEKDERRFFELSDKFESVYKHKEHLEYCISRKIPKEIISKLRVCNEKHFILDKMLIFPFYYKNTKFVYGFQGRHIDKKKFYIYLPKNNSKIYNLFNFNREKPVFILESIIDSFFVENSIAMLGSEIDKNFLKTIYPILVFDNDETGKIKTKKYLELGYKCVIWPKNIKEKDINEMIINEVNFDLNSYIFYGNIGLTKLKLNSKTLY